MGRKNFLLTLILVIFSIISLFVPNPAFAHPGNVSSDGCHFCRTNCGKWGYTFGTRHGHSGQTCDPSKGPIDPLYGGGNGSSNDSSESEDENTPVAPVIIYPTNTPKPIPTSTPTMTPTPTVTPTSTPTITPIPTEIPSPTPTLITTPEVKGITTESASKHFNFSWWILSPLTSLLALIFRWK